MHWPPLHADWDPRLKPELALLIIVGLGLWAVLPWVAAKASWAATVLLSTVGSWLWSMVLALYDGRYGLSRVYERVGEYLYDAQRIGDIGTAVAEFVDRIPYAVYPENWKVHVAGHPPGLPDLVRAARPHRHLRPVLGQRHHRDDRCHRRRRGAPDARPPRIPRAGPSRGAVGGSGASRRVGRPRRDPLRGGRSMGRVPGGARLHARHHGPGCPARASPSRAGSSSGGACSSPTVSCCSAWSRWRCLP